MDKNSTKIRNSREVIEHQIGDYPENWISDDIGIADLNPYIYPNEKELKRIKLFLIISVIFINGVCLKTIII